MSFDALKTLILSFSIGLIILKFLKKGFDMYILWTEGESELPMGTYIMFFVRAVVTALSFEFLFNLLINIAQLIANEFLNSLSLDLMLTDWSNVVNFSVTSLFAGITCLVCTTLCVVLYVQFLVRGIEILILKLGFPLACVGLLDSNSGIFQSYSQKLFRSVLTVIVQVLLCQLGLGLIFSAHWFLAIGTIIMALKTPAFLQEFMLTGNSGGIGAIIMNTSKTIELSRQVKNIITRVK